jgi:hypothetical protein
LAASRASRSATAAATIAGSSGAVADHSAWNCAKTESLASLTSTRPFENIAPSSPSSLSVSGSSARSTQATARRERSSDRPRTSQSFTSTSS